MDLLCESVHPYILNLLGILLIYWIMELASSCDQTLREKLLCHLLLYDWHPIREDANFKRSRERHHHHGGFTRVFVGRRKGNAVGKDAQANRGVKPNAREAVKLI